MITIDLAKPNDARKYIDAWISGFERLTGQKMTFVETSAGRTIHFGCMSDQEAVDVAHILHDLEIEEAKGAVIH